MKTVVDLSVTSAPHRRVRGWSPGLLFDPGVPGGWYDPADPGTVFADVEATQLAQIGEAVARINDKSGNGFHATQATLAARPILREDASGHRYLEFDGVDDRLATAAMDLSGHQTLTAIAGLRKLDSAAARAIAGHSLPSTSPGGFDMVTSTGPNHILGLLARSTAGSTGQVGVTQFKVAPSSCVMLARIDYAAAAGVEVTMRLDGEEFGQSIGLAQENSGSFGNGPLFLGSRPNATMFHNGHLYGFLLIAAALDADALHALETHFTARTGGLP